MGSRGGSIRRQGVPSGAVKGRPARVVASQRAWALFGVNALPSPSIRGRCPRPVEGGALGFSRALPSDSRGLAALAPRAPALESEGSALGLRVQPRSQRGLSAGGGARAGCSACSLPGRPRALGPCVCSCPFRRRARSRPTDTASGIILFARSACDVTSCSSEDDNLPRRIRSTRANTRHRCPCLSVHRLASPPRTGGFSSCASPRSRPRRRRRAREAVRARWSTAAGAATAAELTVRGRLPSGRPPSVRGRRPRLIEGNALGKPRACPRLTRGPRPRIEGAALDHPNRAKPPQYAGPLPSPSREGKI